MPRRERDSHKPGLARGQLSEAELDRILDDAGEATLAGDQARLDAATWSLWQARRLLPELLTRRLIEGRSRIPFLELELLAGFAGPRAATYLRRVAEQRVVPDIIRFGAQRRAGWPERGEAKRRLTFLATLQDAEATLVQAVELASAPWPPDAQMLEEVLGYLAALPAGQQQAVLARAARQLGQQVAWLLRAALHLCNPATQRLALSELVRLREPGTEGPIRRLAHTTADPAVRAEAMAALERLQLRVVGAAQQGAPRPLPPVAQAFLSHVDSVGGQVAIVVRQLADEIFLFADFLHRDDWGIRGVYGSVHADRALVDELITGLQEAGVPLVAVEVAAARGAIAAAMEAHTLSGQPIPPEFELWEPFLHDTYPPLETEAVLQPDLDDAPYAGRRELLARSAALAEHPFFVDWAFELADTSVALLATPPPSSVRLTNKQYQPLLEHLLVGATRQQLRQRLRRQAWLLEQEGDARSRDLTLAVSAQLGQAPPAELGKIPFLRELVKHTLAALTSLALFSRS